MMNIKTNLLKNLIAATVMVFTVGVASALAETIEEKINLLPLNQKDWINKTCSKALGPNLWSSCIERELKAFYTGIPKLEEFNDEDKNWLLNTCSEDLGPNLYKSCLVREIAALKSGIPKLEEISKSNKEWINRTCSKILGPNLYKSCVSRELGAINHKILDSKKSKNLEAQDNEEELQLKKIIKSNLPICAKNKKIEKWDNCIGIHEFWAGNQHAGDYKGEWKDGKLNGSGIFIFNNGDRIAGVWRDNQIIKGGKEDLKVVNSIIASLMDAGNLYKDSEKTQLVSDSKKIEIDKKNGVQEIKKDLPACIVSANSTEEEQLWNSDNRPRIWNNCFATRIFSNGDIYIGEFKNGDFDGQGNITSKLYDYVGEWKEHKRNGYGTSSLGNTFKYIGEHKDGKFDGQGTLTNFYGDTYVGEWKNGQKNGQGTLSLVNRDKYVGEWKNNEMTGQGTYMFADGRKYVGEFKDGNKNGKGIFVQVDGRSTEGIWKNDKLIREVKVNLENKDLSQAKNSSNKNNEGEFLKIAEERKKFEEEKRNREQARNTYRINLQISNTQPNSDGDFVINIKTGADTASLKINGEEFGGQADGNYTIKKVARAGQETKFTIVAKDTNGNTDSKTIAVSRQVTASSQVKYAELNPALVKTQPTKDAVAIIIGIQNYKRVPKAEFASNDAQAFYDYAIRALGVKPENIKLLVDEQADEVEILSAFQNWLPVKVRKQKTDVYVYYSGHGLPSEDGNSLYILPHGADKQYIAKTAINQQEVVAALQASQPKSVTMFIDACYSGQIRTGENLIASARPISIKSNAQLFPAEFTVITASQSDQIASSSAELKHGIFSYYLMKGMEGDADENKDNKITVGEMQSYLQDMVGRKAMSVNRKQSPQLTGDANGVLVGK
jgi:hypothetical protein